MKDYLIKEYTKPDLEDLAKLSHKNHNWIVSLDKDNDRLASKMIDGGKKFAQELVKDAYKDRGKIFMVFVGNKAIGTGTAEVINLKKDLKHSKTQAGKIKNIFIEEKYRSKGIGKVLVAHLEDYLKGRKCLFVRLEVFTPNERAYNLYKKLGYKDRSYNMIKKLK